MVKIVEGKRGSARFGHERRGSAGLARLRQECHRFREEIVCIRTFPRLQLRWPSLARLGELAVGLPVEVRNICERLFLELDVIPANQRELIHRKNTRLPEHRVVVASCRPSTKIGNESSEDGSVWDAAEAERSDRLSISREKGVAEACHTNTVELPSPKLASLHIDSKAEGSASDEQLDGSKESERSLGDKQIGQKTHDLVEASQGCKDGAGEAVCCVARNDEDAMESHRPPDGTSESKTADPTLEPLTSVKGTSSPSHDGSLMDPESGQDFPKGQTLNTVHTHSGARIAATAHFTANPHYNSLERYTDCNANSNFTCQCEGFKLVAFPGSDVSDNTSCKEREVWSEQVLCSSFESHICSPSELNGYITVDGRNQTSTPIETNSLEVGGRAFDESSHILNAHPEMGLLSSLHLVAPRSSSDIDHEWGNIQATIGLNGSEFCMAPVHACKILTGQNQNVLENEKQGRFAVHTTNCLENQRQPTLSVGDPSRTVLDYAQWVDIQNQNGLAQQGKQKHDVFLTDETTEGQTLPTTFKSGLKETSSFPTASSIETSTHFVSPMESKPRDRTLKKQGSGHLGLITLSGMKNFAKLGVGSTRDSAMTAQMAKRIKQALERLGDIGNKEHGHRKSRLFMNKGRSTDDHAHPTYDFEATSENTIVRSDLKRFSNPDRLLRENSEIKRLESHFFKREKGEQINKQTKVETPVLHPIREAKSATPEEPDLYLQSVIAALDSTYKSDISESILETSTDTTGLQAGQHCLTAVQDAELAKAHANGSTLTTPGEVFNCQADKDCVADHRILDSTGAVMADPEEKHQANNVNSTGELIPHGFPTVAEVSTEDLPAFSVQIRAPPGSFLQVDVGGHPTLSGELDEADHQVLGNPLICPSLTGGHQGKFNVEVSHKNSRLSQQKGLQTAPSTHQERPVSPSLHVIDPLYASNRVEEGKQTKQAMKFFTQEDVRHSFDRKITSLVKKANQLQEETLCPDTSPRKQQGSGFHQRHTEVTGAKRQPDIIPSLQFSEPLVHGDDQYEDQDPTEWTDERRGPEKRDAARANESKVRKAERPSILKSSMKAKSLDLESSSCNNHRDRQALEAFGAAAAGLAHELNVLMKGRRSGQNLEGQAPNKRKVAWASPEAYELGPRSAIKRWGSQSIMQPPPPKHSQRTEQLTMHSKSAWPDDAALSAPQAVWKVRKTTDQQKGPFVKQAKVPRRLQPPRKGSVYKKSVISDAVSAPLLPEFWRKRVPQETGIKSEHLLAVQESGRMQATKVLEDSTCKTFDYDQFREELKDLQSERMKLETLVHTIFTNDADPVKQEGNTGDFLARHMPKKPDFTMERARRDSSVEDGDKRKRFAISPNRNSGLLISPDREDHCLGTNHHFKSSQIPKNERLKEVSIRDPQVLDCANGQDDCTITKPAQKKIVNTKSMPQNQTEVKHLTLKHTSDKLQGQSRSHLVAKAIIQSHPHVDRKTNHRVVSTLEQERNIQKSPSSIPSREVFNSDRQDVQDVPDKYQGYTKLPVASSGTQLQEQVQNVGFEGKSEPETHLLATLGFPSTDALHEKFPSLSGVLAVVDTARTIQSADAASKLQLSKPDFFKEYLLQALDSSILLLQHCVSNSEELQDEALLNSPELSTIDPSSELATKMADKCLDSNSNELSCTKGLSEGRTQVTVSDGNLKTPDKQNQPNHLQEHAYHQNLDSTIFPPKLVVPLEQTLDSGKPQTESTLLQTQKMALDRSQESESKVSSSEKETSWSGSLKSVMEAYEEAQRSALLLMSSSLEVQKSKGRTPFSFRSEHSDTLPGAEKKKNHMEGTLNRKETFSPSKLLEKAEKAEAKALKLRLAHKKFLKSRQKSLRSMGLIEEKDQLQGRSRKHSSARELWKVPKLIYRTAEFGLKRREDWNDSTEISHDKHGTGWNTSAKEASQALITKALNEELAKTQRRRGIKNLQHVKPLEAEMRRKRKGPVNLETYANTIALISVPEKPLLTWEKPPVGNNKEINKTKGGQDVDTEKSTPLSMERKPNDQANYFTVRRNVLETESHVLDESTMVFKKTSEHLGSGGNVINQDVRESIEHWLHTSGGFEFLDLYNEAGEEDFFERQESTNSIQQNASSSVITRVSERNLSHNLTFPSSVTEGRRFTNSRTTEAEKVVKDPQGDLVSTSSVANRNSAQCSVDEHHDEFPLAVEPGPADDHASGLNSHSSLKMDKSSLDCSVGILKGSDSDQIVRKVSSLEPAHVDSIYNEADSPCRKDTNRLDGSRCPQGGHIPSTGFCCGTAVSGDKGTEDLLPCQDENAGSPSEEKLTEEEELELALLEIVLHTILKEDPLSVSTATLTDEMQLAPAERHTSGVPCSVPALSGRVTPMSRDDKRLQDGIDQHVQTSVPNLPSLDFLTRDQGIDSGKSSGGDWPEYKCLAEIHSESQSLEEEEHWPEYNGADEQEDLDQGRQIGELPSDQISTSSTNEAETDEKLSGGTVPPQVVAVSTRPPYSAVHSMRAAERQPIDFPGIASLAFGYPSPRPPPSKPIGQPSVNRSSVSVQTADMAITQSTPLSTSVFVFPFYCLPPYSMYLPPPPSPASEVPSQGSTMPMAVPGQHSSQLIASQYAATPTGVVPIFQPPYMFPLSVPFSQGVMPVAPIVQNSQQAPTTAQYPPVQPSSSHPPPTESPFQPSSAVKLAPTSAKTTSSRSRKLRGHVSEQTKLSNRFSDARDSLSSPDSCQSSLVTPSTILSSPDHESRVVSALAPPRVFRGIGGQAFEEGSSDEAEASGLDGLAQPTDEGTLLPSSSMPVKEEEDPLLKSIITENSYKQSRLEVAPARHCLAGDIANPNEFILNRHIASDKPESGASDSIDSARSSVVVASYDGSGSSEGSLKKRTRGKAHVKSSGQSSLDGFFQSKRTSPNAQVGFSQTSSRSSGEILGSNAIPLNGLDENQKMLRRHFLSRTLPLSEGEVEPGQLLSEGECIGSYPNLWHSRPRLLSSRHTEGRDIISEPGEISRQAFVQLRPPRSEVGGDGSSRTESLSEGEVRAETLTEPGEVITNRKLSESQGATGSDDLANGAGEESL